MGDSSALSGALIGARTAQRRSWVAAYDRWLGHIFPRTHVDLPRLYIVIDVQDPWSIQFTAGEIRRLGSADDALMHD
ncbi:MAG: hypothetical protein O6951_01285, partial [Actinobacteria bacterium]|nr:hypothetical protein [Actinomycetota bacterium]